MLYPADQSFSSLHLLWDLVPVLLSTCTLEVIYPDPWNEGWICWQHPNIQFCLLNSNLGYSSANWQLFWTRERHLKLTYLKLNWIPIPLLTRSSHQFFPSQKRWGHFRLLRPKTWVILTILSLLCSTHPIHQHIWSVLFSRYFQVRTTSHLHHWLSRLTCHLPSPDINTRTFPLASSFHM